MIFCLYYLNHSKEARLHIINCEKLAALWIRSSLSRNFIRMNPQKTRPSTTYATSIIRDFQIYEPLWDPLSWTNICTSKPKNSCHLSMEDSFSYLMIRRRWLANHYPQFSEIDLQKLHRRWWTKLSFINWDYWWFFFK